MNGYACKKCGGPAPTGVGYAVAGQAPDPARTVCGCGYSVAPVVGPVDRIIEAVKAVIPGAVAVELEVADFDAWEAGEAIEVEGMWISDVVRDDGRKGFQSFPDRMLDLRVELAPALRNLPTAWLGENVNDDGYATIRF